MRVGFVCELEGEFTRRRSVSQCYEAVKGGAAVPPEYKYCWRLAGHRPMLLNTPIDVLHARRISVRSEWNVVMCDELGWFNFEV